VEWRAWRGVLHRGMKKAVLVLLLAMVVVHDPLSPSLLCAREMHWTCLFVG
jgi:hypothetical protein